MNTLDLQNLGLEEMNEMEVRDVEGGIAPLILGAWGAMIVMDCICIGLYAGYHNN